MTREQTDTTWIVLRCASSKTVALVEGLQQRGIHAWTPVWNRKRQMPRSNVHRIVELPCIPSFVFVPSEQEYPCRYFSRSVSLPGFTVMRLSSGPVYIPDSQLGHLRRIADAPVRMIGPLPKVGDRMRFKDGIFHGLHCIVRAANKKFVSVEVVEFPNNPPVQIPPSILERIAA